MSNPQVSITNQNVVVSDDNNTLTITKNQITGLDDTISGYANSLKSAATVGYVNNLTSGMDVKESCRVTTNNVNLSGYTTENITIDSVNYTVNCIKASSQLVVDGVTPVADDRILVKNQSNSWENGIYIVIENDTGTSHIRRATDADNVPDNELTDGAFTFVTEGTQFHDTGFILTAKDTAEVSNITAGTITFTQFSSSQSAFLPSDSIDRIGNKFHFTGFLEDGTITVVSQDGTSEEAQTYGFLQLKNSQHIKDSSGNNIMDHNGHLYTTTQNTISTMTGLSTIGSSGATITAPGKLSATQGFIGNITGNVTGEVTGDVTGNLTGEVTGDVTGNLTGEVTGDVTGNLTGEVTGDVTGNLTGTVLTATQNSVTTMTGLATIGSSGSTITAAGPLTASEGVVGDLTGNVTGDVSSSGTSTFATVDINGGAIDGAAIGANSASTGAFTTLSASSGVTVSGGDITVSTGDINVTAGDVILGTDQKFDGTIGADGGSNKQAFFTNIKITGTAALGSSVDINGGAIDGTAIGGDTASSGAFTTVTASGDITGDLIGDVTGDVTGNLTGTVLTATQNTITTMTKLASVGTSGSTITAAGPVAASEGVVGDVTGNVTGEVTGDVTGNITGTVLTATQNSITTMTGLATIGSSGSTTTAAGPISASEGLLGNVTGNVTGEVTGDVTGNITGTVLTATQNSITTMTGLATIGSSGSTTTAAGPVSGSEGFFGDITGNVTGEVTGDVTGNLTGTVLTATQNTITTMTKLASVGTSGSTITAAGPVAGSEGFIGNITGNVTGEVTGDVTGNLTGEVTGDVTGNLTGDVTGDVTGNLTGEVTGDVTGNITGTVLTATQNTITTMTKLASVGTSGSTITAAGPVAASEGVVGDVTGNVTGEVTGDVTGNLTGEVTGDVTGNLTGDVTGDVTGNLTGEVTGDVTGNLTGTVLTATQNTITTMTKLASVGTSGSTITAAGPVAGSEGFIGNITGNVTGEVTGDVTGNLTGEVTGDVTGNLTGDVTGDVTGNLTGEVTGDVTGNLTGTVLTATQNTITTMTKLASVGTSGSTITAAGPVAGSEGFIGNITGNVTGEVTGDVTGNITGTVLTATQNSITTMTGLATIGSSGSTTTAAGPISASEGLLGDVTGNVTGEVTGDVTGNITGTVLTATQNSITTMTGLASVGTSGSTITAAGPVSGSEGFIGNITGNVTGEVTGDVTGNITGTVLTATQNTITTMTKLASVGTSGSTITAAGPVAGSEGFIGDVTGDVTGNLAGEVTGDVTGNLTGTVLTTTQNSITTMTGLATIGSSGSTTTAAGPVSGSEGFIGNITGNVTGEVTGDVTGNLTGTVLTATQNTITTMTKLASVGTSGSTITAAGPVSGSEGFIGDITGNVTGEVTGDVTGNITGTVLTTTQNTITTMTGLASVGTSGSTITAAGPVSGSEGFIGNITGNVTGEVTGDVTGNLTGTVLTATQNTITTMTKLASVGTSGSTITAAGPVSGSEGFIGNITGNLTGDVTGDVSGNVIGPFGSFTTLEAGSMSFSSDIRLKENLIKIENPLDTLEKIQGYKYNWKNTSSVSHGVIAQEIEEIVPSMVKGSGEEMRGVDYIQFIPFLIESVKVLNKEVNTLKEKINS